MVSPLRVTPLSRAITLGAGLSGDSTKISQVLRVIIFAAMASFRTFGMAPEVVKLFPQRLVSENNIGGNNKSWRAGVKAPPRVTSRLRLVHP